MDRRSTGSLAVFAGAVLIIIAVLYPTWFSRDGEPSYRDYPSALGPRNDNVEARMGTAGRGVSIMALAAVPLCIAAAIAGLKRRVPFLLCALAGVAAGAFGLMTLILRADMGEEVKASYSIGGGFVLAIFAAILGAVGNVMLAGWSMSEEAREADAKRQ